MMFPKPVKKEKKRKGLRRVGDETRRWAEARKVLKAAFTECGITHCEVQLPKRCLRYGMLSFAHGDKRRHLTREELYSLVIVACIPCHQYIEHQISRQEMREFVEAVIERRDCDVMEVVRRLGSIDERGFFVWR